MEDGNGEGVMKTWQMKGDVSWSFGKGIKSSLDPNQAPAGG